MREHATVKKETHIGFYIVTSVLFALAGAVYWWRVSEDGFRGAWVIPAVCFTAGAAIQAGLILKRHRSR
jgi:hypothetical protein